MSWFSDCCRSENVPIGQHKLWVLEIDPRKWIEGIQAIAAIVPSHYVSPRNVARALENLGKSAAASKIRQKLPTKKPGRSGDLGEILATEWIDTQGDGYIAPIKRLRWKDHPEMPMRGDDVIAIQCDRHSQCLRFLKAEAKSAMRLTAHAVQNARDALSRDEGCPAPHSLAFISERLAEQGKQLIADAIEAAQLRDGINKEDVRHLLFTLSGNDPQALLSRYLEDYQGRISQWSVGLQVEDHASFVKAVYDQVIADADNP
ncbi:MAG: SAVED domain-containing protein [Bacteroidota bacterium]|nr:SAVED domain-containing protein [Bacteroidota bacterium]